MPAVPDALGLGKDVEPVYETLLTHPSRSRRELLRAHPAIDGPQLDRILARLVRRGLVRALPGGRPRYEAVAPDLVLGGLVADRQRDLDRMLQRVEELRGRYASARRDETAPMIQIVPGGREATQMVVQLHKAVRYQVRSLETPPYGTPTAMMMDDEVDAIGNGVRYRMVYSRAATQELDAEINASVRAGEQARVIDEVPLRLGIMDDWAAVLPGRPGRALTDGLVVVHPGTLLNALIALFESVWERAVPISADSQLPLPEDTCTWSAADEELIVLLSAGLGDQAIARHLGVGLRTVQRRVQRILRELRASSRFQAGLAIGLRKRGARVPAELDSDGGGLTGAADGSGRMAR